jgi:predicted small lipoprotein YifL
MNRPTLTMATALFTLTACGLKLPDPCADTSPLQADPDVAAMCEQQETGGDDNDDELICALGNPEFDFCARRPTLNEPFLVDPNEFDIRSSVECVSTGPEFKHVKSWFDVEEPRVDLWCSPKPVGQNSGSGVWRLCRDINDGVSDFRPGSSEYYPATDATVQGAEWTNTASCIEYTDTMAGECVMGMVSIGDETEMYGGAADSIDAPYAPGEWTCACESDVDCQDGAVCEAGWTIVDGFPRATLCIWDDGSGTSNGAAPDGPEVYGLTEWSDGIIAARDNVRITGAMLLALVPGVFNDDQRFDEFGTLTHCGPKALCAQLGLAAGDTVLAEQEHLDDLMDGIPAAIPVIRADGSTHTLSVSLEFDGAL